MTSEDRMAKEKCKKRKKGEIDFQITKFPSKSTKLEATKECDVNLIVEKLHKKDRNHSSYKLKKKRRKKKQTERNEKENDCTQTTHICQLDVEKEKLEENSREKMEIQFKERKKNVEIDRKNLEECNSSNIRQGKVEGLRVHKKKSKLENTETKNVINHVRKIKGKSRNRCSSENEIPPHPIGNVSLQDNVIDNNVSVIKVKHKSKIKTESKSSNATDVEDEEDKVVINCINIMKSKKKINKIKDAMCNDYKAESATSSKVTLIKSMTKLKDEINYENRDNNRNNKVRAFKTKKKVKNKISYELKDAIKKSDDKESLSAKIKLINSKNKINLNDNMTFVMDSRMQNTNGASNEVIMSNKKCKKDISHENNLKDQMNNINGNVTGNLIKIKKKSENQKSQKTCLTFLDEINLLNLKKKCNGQIDQKNGQVKLIEDVVIVNTNSVNPKKKNEECNLINLVNKVEEKNNDFNSKKEKLENQNIETNSDQKTFIQTSVRSIGYLENQIHKISAFNEAKINNQRVLNDEKLKSLNENNDHVSKLVDKIVKTKINNYLCRVFNRPNKVITPNRELKEKKIAIIKNDPTSLGFNLSNLSNVLGYKDY